MESTNWKGKTACNANKIFRTKGRSLKKNGNISIVPILTLDGNRANLNLTCSLLIPHHSFNSSTNLPLLSLTLQRQHDSFLLGCINHNDSGHQEYKSRKSPSEFFRSAYQSTKGALGAHVAMLNETYPSTTMTQFFSSTLDM